MRIVNLNARSVRLKSADLELFLHLNAYPEIVCITETWLSDDETTCFKLNHYEIASYFCRDSCGGGVAIFVRSGFSTCKCIENKDFSLSNDFECAAALLQAVNNVKILVCCIYRPPSSPFKTFSEYFEKLLKLLCKPNILMCFCGDFNYNFISRCREAVHIVDAFSSYGLKQVFVEPSRTQGSSCTLIDNAFTNAALFSAETHDLTFSDHCAQILTVEMGNSVSPDLSKFSISSRIFSNENIHFFNNLLSREHWPSVLETLDFESKFSYFFDTFSSLFNMSFPYVTKRKPYNKKSNQWITPLIINEGKQLRLLHTQLKSIHNQELISSYKHRLKVHKENITNAKKAYNSTKLLTSNNITRASWEIINSTTNFSSRKTKCIPNLVTDNGEMVTGSLNIANTFNSFFIESVRNITDNFQVPISTNMPFNSLSQSLFLFPLTEGETLEIIKCSSRKKSSGVDEIPCYLLLACADQIVSPLTYLLNLSFQFGYFPKELKTAVVIPLHKKGETAEVSNYRPIALLSVFSKIFEKAFKRRLVAFLDSNGVLSCHQFGFRAGFSTSDAIVSLYTKILNNFELKLKSVGILFDFTKAFDTINHALLLNKIFHYGVRGPAHKWLESYLTGRTQAVKLKVGGQVTMSDWTAVVTGVPQGSVLGPILFLLFINDLPLLVSDSYITLFADDTSAIISGNDYQSLHSKATKCIADIAGWCQKNGLCLNTLKTNFIVFTPVRAVQDQSLLLREGSSSTLIQQESAKFLGIVIDRHLSWDPQVESVCNRLSRSNYAILQLRDYVDAYTLKSFYYASVHSTLSYALLAWGNSSSIERVLISQKRIIRTMFRLSFRETCRDTFRKENILTIINIYILQCSCHVHKNLTSHMRSGDLNFYNTRNADKLYIPFTRLSQVQDGPEITSLKIFNHLPCKIKNAGTFPIFKKALKTMLGGCPFYSLTEFFNCSFID